MTIAFVGTGGHAKSVYDLVKKKKILFFDRKKKKFIVNNKVFNVISDLEISKKYRKKITKIIITIGNNKIRKKYYNFFKKKKINFSIELGAHISRHCDFRNEEFLKSHNLTKNKISKFNKYLNKWHFNESPYSNWEIKKNLNFSYKEEISDIIASINFVKKIYGKQ